MIRYALVLFGLLLAGTDIAAEPSAAGRTAFEAGVVGRRVVSKVRIYWLPQDNAFTRLTRKGKVRYGMWLEGHFIADPDPVRVLSQLGSSAPQGGTAAGNFMPPGTSYTVTGMRWTNDELQISLKDDYGNAPGFLVEWGER
jgi:hypothetical protein